MEDMEKAERLWQSMNEATGEEKPFPASEVQDALAMCAQFMVEEDPDSIIFCSCHGDPWPSRDVDLWGLCPYGQER